MSVGERAAVSMIGGHPAAAGSRLRLSISQISLLRRNATARRSNGKSYCRTKSGISRIYVS